jgi:hypothetical protein
VLDAVEESTIGIAKGPNALPLEPVGDLPEVVSGARDAGENVGGPTRIDGEGLGDLAMVAEGAQSRLGHRVDHPGTDQLGDVGTSE